MWRFAIFFVALLAQYNDKDDVKTPTLDILKSCGFTNEEFEHLKSIFTTDVPELRKKIDATREARNKRMDQLWASAKERAKKLNGNAESDDILDDELRQIKEFLNEVSNSDGSAILGAGKPMTFSLIQEDEREKIFAAIRGRYKEGATSSKDFKVMFNVMRAFLVIRGSEHIDEAKKESQEQKNEEDRAKKEEKRKDEDRNRRSNPVAPVNRGSQDGEKEHEAPRYGNGEWKGDMDAPKGKRTKPYTQMEKDHGHHLPPNQEDQEDESDDPERGDEDEDDEEESEKKGNDAKYGKEPVDSIKDEDEQNKEKPKDEEEKQEPKKLSGKWEDINPSEGDSNASETSAAPEISKTPSEGDSKEPESSGAPQIPKTSPLEGDSKAPESTGAPQIPKTPPASNGVQATQQPVSPGSPTAPAANQTPQQPDAAATATPQGAPGSPAQQGGALPAASVQQGNTPPANSPGGTNKDATGGAATSPQQQPGNPGVAPQTGVQPSPGGTPPSDTPGEATPVAPAQSNAQPPAQGPASGNPPESQATPTDNGATAAKPDANPTPAGADNTANNPSTPPTSSLLTSIPGALHFTTTQLRYSIYIFCLFVVIVGCYFLSPTKDSELDYLLIDGDDEI